LRRGFPELKPRGDLFGTPDGTAAAPYIRESRGIKALTTIVQQDLDADDNPGPRAKLYPDSCGISLYGGTDIHRLAAAGMPQSFAKPRPFQIPLGALIPVRVTPRSGSIVVGADAWRVRNLDTACRTSRRRRAEVPWGERS